MVARTRRARALPRSGAIALCLAAASAFSPLAQADGYAFKGRDAMSMTPLAQREQRAAILWHDGVQRMVVAINVGLDRSEQGLWLLPIPGTPGSVKVEVVGPQAFLRRVSSTANRCLPLHRPLLRVDLAKRSLGL
jgi:hypothetical protein